MTMFQNTAAPTASGAATNGAGEGPSSGPTGQQLAVRDKKVPVSRRQTFYIPRIVFTNVRSPPLIFCQELNSSFPTLSAHRAWPDGEEAGACGQHRRLGHVDLTARLRCVQRSVLGLVQTRGHRAL